MLEVVLLVQRYYLHVFVELVENFAKSFAATFAIHNEYILKEPAIKKKNIYTLFIYFFFSEIL